MHFYITIKHQNQNIRLKVVKVLLNNEMERFLISARNGHFVIQGNRPLLQSRGLKHKKILWKVVEGGYDRPYILEQITKALETYLRKNE